MNAREFQYVPPPPPPPKPKKPKGRMRLTERDKQLLLAVAMARHLSYEQLHQLFFKKWSANSVKARLRELCGLGERPAQPAPLDRVPYFERDGMPASAYRLTPFGRDYAAELMPTLRFSTWSGEANESLVHDLGCAQVFVELAAACAGPSGIPDMRKLPFSWRSGRRLPYRESTDYGFKKVDRVIIPDAIVEFPAQKRRVLIEFETGSQPIVPKNPRKRGSATEKLRRWSCFIAWGGHLSEDGRTGYQRAFDDDLSPEVHFVTVREPRAQSLRELIKDAKREQKIARDVAFYALVRTAFVEHLLGLLGVKPGGSAEPTRPKRAVNTQERVLLHTFYNEAVSETQQTRHAIRDHNASTGARLAEPRYPASAEAVAALLNRLNA